MSRAFRYTTIGLMWILAVMLHWFGVTFFAPGTNIYALADPGVGMFVQSGWRPQMYKVFAQYLPLLFIGGSLAWGFAKEYEDAVYTGVRR